MGEKRALITGIAGQDGSYLADILIEKGYKVFGLQRHSSNPDWLWRIKHLEDKVTVLAGDVTDPFAVRSALDMAEPHELYHEADQDNVSYSNNSPHTQVDVTVKGTLNVLEAVQDIDLRCRVFLPLSATMFKPSLLKINENSLVSPTSVYGACKVAAMALAGAYSDLWVAQSILFSHDSPRRGPGYLLQRIARDQELWGSPGHVVDIGHTREYMEAAWRMMQLDEPTTAVIGTGRGYTVGSLREGSRAPIITPDRECLIADPRKVESLTGWKATMDAAAVLWEIKEHLCQTGAKKTEDKR